MSNNHLHPTYGWGWRTKNRKLQKFVTIEVEDPSGTVDEFYAQLKEVAEPLQDARVTLEAENSSYAYGRDRDFLAVTGWRPATPEEIAKLNADIEARERAATDREEQEIARLKAARPDLFKD